MKLKIKELREEVQLTQTELAKKIGTSQRNVSNWETGTSEPDLETIGKLADIFGVSIDELFGKDSVVTEVRQLEGLDRLLVRKVRSLGDEQKAALLAFLNGFTR